MDKKDKLEMLFEMQKDLNSFITTSRNLDTSDKNIWLQRQTLAMLSEMAELLNEINFKWWKNEKPIDSVKVKEEIVDIFHFFISMCLTADLSADELFKMYLSKNEENFKRQQGTSIKSGYELKK